MLKKLLQERFNTSAISAQVLPFSTWNKNGEPVEARQLVVLDAEDRFMFIISYDATEEYIFDGCINYEKIYRDFILTEAQWEALKSESQTATKEEITN